MNRIRAIRLGLLACGAIGLVILVVQIGPTTVLTAISGMGWRLLLVLCFPFALITLFDTLGWHFAFARSRVPFGVLLGARLAGEALNMTTPTAQVGGEAVKAWLLRHHVSFDESLPSVIVAKTTITIAQGALLVVGIVCALFILPTDSLLVRGMGWLLLVEVVAIAGFIAVQMAGVVAGGRRLLDTLSLGWITQRLEPWLGVDRALAGFYRNEPRRLLLSFSCHFVGWLVSVLETYLIFHFLDVPVSLGGAAVIEAFGTAVRFATFLVPGGLGVLEGGHVAASVALGFEAAAGMSFSLVRRVREVAWVGVGFVALAAMRPAATSVSAPREV